MRAFLVALVIVLWGGSCLFFHERAAYRAIEPHGATFDDFVRQFGIDVYCVRLVDAEQTGYTLCIGPRWDTWKGTSGMPEYLFDAHGRLVDWVPDNGDKPMRYHPPGELKDGPHVDTAVLETELR